MTERADAPPDATTQAHDPTAVIRAGDDVVTFVQVWTMTGAEAQRRWLEVMHESIHILRRRPGFISMNLHASIDGARIAVYAQWSSRENLEAAINDPQAVAAHDRMAEIGASDGSLYTVERVYGPGG